MNPSNYACCHSESHLQLGHLYGELSTFLEIEREVMDYFVLEDNRLRYDLQLEVFDTSFHAYQFPESHRYELY